MKSKTNSLLVAICAFSLACQSALAIDLVPGSVHFHPIAIPPWVEATFSLSEDEAQNASDPNIANSVGALLLGTAAAPFALIVRDKIAHQESKIRNGDVNHTGVNVNVNSQPNSDVGVTPHPPASAQQAKHTSGPPPAFQSPQHSDVLNPGEGLNPGASINSPNGKYTLILQGDDKNLVLYNNLTHRALWNAGTNQTPVASAIMQGDGNFVLYDNVGNWYWCSETNGHPNAFLKVQDDGNVVIYTPDNTPLFATKTVGE